MSYTLFSESFLNFLFIFIDLKCHGDGPWCDEILIDKFWGYSVETKSGTSRSSALEDFLTNVLIMSSSTFLFSVWDLNHLDIGRLRFSYLFYHVLAMFSLFNFFWEVYFFFSFTFFFKFQLTYFYFPASISS